MPKKKYIFDERKAARRRAHPEASKPGAFMPARSSNLAKHFRKAGHRDVLFNRNTVEGMDALIAFDFDLMRDQIKKRKKNIRKGFKK